MADPSHPDAHLPSSLLASGAALAAYKAVCDLRDRAEEPTPFAVAIGMTAAGFTGDAHSWTLTAQREARSSAWASVLPPLRAFDRRRRAARATDACARAAAELSPDLEQVRE